MSLKRLSSVVLRRSLSSRSSIINGKVLPHFLKSGGSIQSMGARYYASHDAHSKETDYNYFECERPEDVTTINFTL